MKQYIIFLSLFTVLFAFSACDNATEISDPRGYVDKIEAARHFVETIDSIDYWYTEIKDTFKLSEVPYPRITIGIILNSETDTVVAGIVNDFVDTVYFSQTRGSVLRDTMNIFKMPNLRGSSAGTYKMFGYYIHKGTKTVLPEKVFYMVR